MKEISDNKSQKVIKLYYGFQLFFNLLLWIPIFYEFQKQIGLSDPEIFQIQSIYYLAFVVFELPTGYIADKIGKSTALQLGAATLVFANLIPVFFGQYLFFLLHFLMIAVARSLVSGSANAYLYDYLVMSDLKQEYKKVEGRARSMALMARVIAWPSVGFLMGVYLKLPYIVTAAFCFMAFLFSLSFRDLGQKEKSQTSKKFSLKGEFDGIGNIFKSSPVLYLLMLQGAGVFILQRVCLLQLFQPLLKAKDFSVESFGIIMSAITVFEALGASQSHHIKKWLADYQAVFALNLVLAVSFGVLIFLNPAMTLLGLTLFSFVCGLTFPIQKQLLNDHISDSSYRATVLSVESIFDRVLASIFTWGIGLQMGKGELSPLFVYTAGVIILMVIIVFLSIWSRRKHLNVAVEIE